TEVLAVEPSDLGWERSARRRAEGGPPVRRVGLDAQRIELDDAAVDHAVSTWTMCTIPDIDTALAEVRRVLRPGGTLRFVEHGLAEQPSVQRWQHRLTPLQRRVAGGCHLDRDIDGIVEASGLQLEALERFTVPG